jgi:hypothetical protein
VLSSKLPLLCTLNLLSYRNVYIDDQDFYLKRLCKLAIPTIIQVGFRLFVANHNDLSALPLEQSFSEEQLGHVSRELPLLPRFTTADMGKYFQANWYITVRVCIQVKTMQFTRHCVAEANVQHPASLLAKDSFSSFLD